MKTILLFLTIFSIAGLSAQTRATYGLFKKSDGAQIKGTIKTKGFEDEVVINSYTGGSDNSATIEIEVPVGTYVADFRNLMNADVAANQSTGINKTVVANKPVAAPATTIKQDIGVSPSPNLKQVLPQPQQPTLARTEVSVIDINPPNYPHRIVSKIILEDIKVESCTDNAATGTSKIKLKASRIGWVYYSYDIKGNQTSTQSGWNVIAGKSWNTF